MKNPVRVLKVIAFVVFLAIVGLFAYVLVIGPALWHPLTRRESIRILEVAKSTNELAKAVGNLGLFMPLTNGAWIAIRYRDSHSGAIRSYAVARDSGGSWFESERHFCGSLRGWPHTKESVAMEDRWRKEVPDLFTNRVSRADPASDLAPSYRDMMAIESAPDLESARRALLKIGFTELKP